MSVLEVLAPGLLTTVQDLVGRPGYARYGVPESGPVDRLAAAAANALVGNPPDTAIIEITVDGPILRFDAMSVVALTGAEIEATLDGRPVAMHRSVRAPVGATLILGRVHRGARAYLAVAGGIAVAPVLGSRSADVRNGLGHPPLRRGDRLPIGPADGAGPLLRLHAPLPLDGPIRILPGPHVDRLGAGTLPALTAGDWRVSDASDRQGCRLIGPHLEGGEVDSLGLPAGAIQLPPDGRPIIMLAERQPTGGYPVVALVIAADLRLVGQRLPGSSLRLSITDSETAHAAAVALERLVETTVLDPDDASGWAGALE